MTDEALEYRVAGNGDATGILTVLQEVASEVPVSLDSAESEEIIRSIIAECCSSGESWVAIDRDGTVVGFVLAKPDRLERFLQENQAVSLRYIGVRRNWRQRGIFAALMEDLKAKGVPLTASVLHTNRSAMADRLLKIGFTKVEAEADTKETRLRWDPSG